MRLKNFISRKALPTYFTLVFLIAWCGSFFVALPSLMRRQPMAFSDIALIAIPMFLAPPLASFGLTAYLEGRAGLRELLARIGRGRVGLCWYLPILIFPAVILVVQLLLTALVSPGFRPGFFLPGIAAGLIAGFFEEVGWTGFAYPRMRLGSSAVAAGFTLGAIHGLWHMAADYFGAGLTRGAYWLPHFIAFAAFLTAARLIIAWVYEHTESVLLAQLMHASFTGSLAVLVSMELDVRLDMLFYIVFSLALFAVDAWLVHRYGRQLKRQQQPA